MNPINSSIQASVYQSRAVNQAAASGHSTCQAGDIVKAMIGKISSKQLLEAEGSAAHSPASLSTGLGMMLACMGDNADKEKMLGIPKGTLTPELEDEIHGILGKFSKNHPCDNIMGPNDDNPVVTVNGSVSRFICQNDKYPEILSKHYLAKHLLHREHPSKKCPVDTLDEHLKAKTNNRIPCLPTGDHFVDVVNRDIIDAAICNVMEIKANWETAFSSNKTGERIFQCEDGAIIENVLMMHTTDSLQFVRNSDFKAISKDFKSADGEHLKLVVITPSESSPTKIKDLDRQAINNLMEQLAHSPKQQVDLALPIMEIEVSNNELLEVVNKALDTDISAKELTSLNVGEHSYLRITQKIKASVDERGARIKVASAAVSRARGFSHFTNEEFSVNCPSFVVITNGEENLLEATLKCEKFLSTRGDAEISYPDNSRESSRSWVLG